MNLKEISEKWQKKWKETDLYKVREDTSKPKFYVLDMFPYPSGAGLHVGHPKGYIASDTLARKKMLEGFNVLHPMGFDTFGLGTENYAIEHKMKPQDVAKQNIETYIKQLEMFGTTYDRSRSVNTADPEYFKRTQRVFLQMYNHYYDSETNKAEDVKKLELKIESGKLKVPGGLTKEQFINSQRLAYVDFKPINRCPKCMTGLANEDLDDGKCERCGSEVEQKPMKQRVLRITKYAERLLEGLDTLKREESMKDLERNRIGKSEGTQFKMKVITEEKDKAAWMVIEKSIEPSAMPELLSFGKTNIEETSSNRGNFYRILIDKKDEKKFIEFLSKHMKTKNEKGNPEYRYADSGGTTNMVIFSGGKIFNTSTDEGCKDARDFGISLGIPEHQVRFSPRAYAPGYTDHSNHFEVYTTRIDTVYGMSFVAIAPEHPLVDKITTKECKKEVEAYKDAAKKKTQLERTELQKDKTGVFCGAYAINPFNNQKVPIFVADYVLANYGTGAVMAVPAHDERDMEFAKKYNLPITQSIMFVDKQPHPEAEKRQSISAIVHRTSDNKFLMVKWKQYGRVSPVVGGIDEGEDALQAAEREVLEETGYHAKAIKKIGRLTEANYFADNKKVWRQRVEQPVLLELVDENTSKIDADEDAKHESIWLSYEEAMAQISHPENLFGLTAFVKGDLAFCEYGRLIHSGEFTGLMSQEAIPAMQQRLEKKKIGGVKVNYKMQDRVFSRQRYRGEPFPILRISEEGRVTSNEGDSALDTRHSILPMDAKDLPLELPDVENYAPTGTTEGPLANITDWVNVTLPDGTQAKRETNTMPGRAGSSRYWLRYMDPTNDKALVGKDKEKYRGNVDVYIGGAEHVTRHMIYGRFWQKFLYDIGAISHDEPFQEYHYVGLIMGEDGRKMSKRRGNVVNPDDIISQFGADTLRTYEMFMGPFEQSIAWNTAGISGTKKFLDKVAKLAGSLKLEAGSSVLENQEEDRETLTLLNQTIKKVTENIDEFKFNTAISQLMILTNHLTDIGSISRTTFETLVILISPFAPHLAEELWEQLGNEYSIFTKAKRPCYNEKCLIADTITIAVQVNGKVRGTICIDKDADQKQALELAKADTKIAARIVNEPKKVIYVPGKILNIVV